MSVNKYKPHLFIIPEVDANRQMANGFVLEVKNDRHIQILPEVGGWSHVVEIFLSQHVNDMRNYPGRHIILLFDFDHQAGRFSIVSEKIPEDLRDRVFLLGTLSEPEALKQAGLGSLEDIGRKLAEECRDGLQVTWSHDLLKNNLVELGRLKQSVRDFLF